MTIKNVSFKEYTQLFYKALPPGFQYQDTSVQLYDLKQVAKYLLTPTPLIRAEFSFMVYLSKGYFEQQVGNEIQRVRAGSILFSGHGQVTSLIKITPEIEGYFLIFENNALNTLADNRAFLKLFLANPLIKLSKQNNRWIEKMAKLLYQEVSAPDADNEVAVHLLKTMLLKIIAASEMGHNFTREYEIAVTFRELAYQHFITQKEVSFYAHKMGISENYMSRCVKKALYKTPKELLQEITLTQSQIYLSDLSKTITEVAYQLNFDDPSYFGRLFKKVFGYTPSEYRSCLMHSLSE